MKNHKLNQNYSRKEEEKIIAELSAPNYPRCNLALPENATALEKSKYELCKKILAYKQDHALNTEQLAHQINLTIPETESILFARINEFTLDRLITYASCLLAPFYLAIISENKKVTNAV
jgi:predicted XRE-type DNA-binding protein